MPPLPRCRHASAGLLLVLVLSLSPAPAAPAVELNAASRADLEAMPGVGPDLAERILTERERRAFEGWADLIARVRGVGRASAARLSAQGLRVNGQPLPSTRRAD